MATATIIAALIGAGVSIWAGMKNNEATSEANKQGLKLANIQRQDTLKEQAENRAFQQQQFGFQKEQAAISNDQFNRQFSHQLSNDQVTRGIQLLNSNQELLNSMANRFAKRM